MEIHHRSHGSHPAGHKKKLTHYFWEFFMLFLAVTLGFLVENMREHRIENKREKSLMHALLADLDADMRQIDSLMKRRVLRNADCDSLISLLSKADKQNGSLQYYYGRNASRRIHFRPQDGTLQQLRNSGGFRVVHDEEVLQGINAYELGLKNNLENIEVEEKELTEYTAIAAKIFNAAVFQGMTRNNIIEKPGGNPALLTYDRALLNELSIKLHYWKRTSLSVLESWNGLKNTADLLIRLVKDKYHIK